MVVLLSLLLACDGPDPEIEDSTCEAPGDIDDVRLEMYHEACAWVLTDCDYMPNRMQDCFAGLGHPMIEPVEQGMCLDWCGARAFHQTVRDRDCSEIPEMSPETIPNEYGPLAEELLSYFYVCDAPNYDPPAYPE